MRFCEFDKGCDQPVFSTDKLTRKGYCNRHTWCRTDVSKKSITQRAIEKHKTNPTKQIVKEPRFKRAGTFDESVLVDNEAEMFNKQSGGIEQWSWFEEQRIKMDGNCHHCGNKSCKDDNDKFHFSICHLMPKAYFPSVSTHPDNWIELCFWGNNCHGNMDNKILDLTQMNCWDEIVTKFIKVYPSIDKKERRRIPSVLLQYIDTEL